MNTMLCPACGFENIEGTDRCENCMTPLRNLDVPRADATRGVVSSVMQTCLSELPLDDALQIEAEETLTDAIQKMNANQNQCALIIENSALAGIIGEREITKALTANDETDEAAQPAERAQSSGQVTPAAPSETLTVQDAMMLSPETLSEADTVAAALNKMAFERVRYVPILKDDGTHAVLSTANLLRYIAKEDW